MQPNKIITQGVLILQFSLAATVGLVSTFAGCKEKLEDEASANYDGAAASEEKLCKQTKIAFVSNSNPMVAKGYIFIMNSNGTGIERLTAETATYMVLSWSPDGRKIACSSNIDGNFEIYTMNSDGTSRIRLTNNPASDTDPSWSPDGTKIAFVSTRDVNSQIYVMNADGSEQTRLTNNSLYDSAPSWSPFLVAEE